MCNLKNASLIAMLAMSLIALPALGSASNTADNTSASAQTTGISGAVEVKPNPKPNPTPLPEWTRIEPGEVDMYQSIIPGWTVFNLQATGQSPVDAYIFDSNWNLLASFDSTGCGAFLQVDAQLVYIVIENRSKISNTYLLSVFN